MQRIELSEGIVRVKLAVDEAAGFAPIPFVDETGEYLRQVGFACEERPVYRLKGHAGGEVKRTANGEVVVFDEGEREFIRMSHSAALTFACPEGSVLTGLGQHEDGAFNYAHGEERLYQHNMKIAIPFLLSSAGWGLLIEAGCAMRYRGTGDGFTFCLDAADEISYVVIRGRDCAEVLKKLSGLTGKPALLPKWAYGYIQSKERYTCADELLNVTREFRRRGLGLDCIVLDWMSWNEGCWGDKTPDPSRFPDVKALTDALHGMDARFMVSVWPNCGKGRDCEEFEAAGLFLPGSQIYDAFNGEARDMYWDQCRRTWMDGGADALWCDSCEPITDPDWCGEEKRDADERMRLITEASALRMDPATMNDYGAVHLRGLSEHWRRDYPGKRPVLLSRSGGIDSSSLGAILWSGDVAARWEVLEKQVAEGIKASLSGLCWWTLDIGAFFVGQKEPWFWRGDYPDGVDDPDYRELYVRWFQFGAMLPVFRSHGTDTPREPWRFGGEGSGEYETIRDMIDWRYRLMPYLYATAAQSCREGLPMLRAMLLAFPGEAALHGLSDQYLLGDALLVKPVTQPLSRGGETTGIVLPEAGWYNLFTREYIEGGRTVKIDTPLDRFPVFVRAGSILPMAEGAKSADGATVKELWVFEGDDGAFTLYDDPGDGPAFAEGQHACVPMRYEDAAGTLTLGAAEGGMAVDWPLTVRHIRRDGSQDTTRAHYRGEAIQVKFSNSI